MAGLPCVTSILPNTCTWHWRFLAYPLLKDGLCANKGTLGSPRSWIDALISHHACSYAPPRPEPHHTSSALCYQSHLLAGEKFRALSRSWVFPGSAKQHQASLAVPNRTCQPSRLSIMVQEKKKFNPPDYPDNPAYPTSLARPENPVPMLSSSPVAPQIGFLAIQFSTSRRQSQRGSPKKDQLLSLSDATWAAATDSRALFALSAALAQAAGHLSLARSSMHLHDLPPPKSPRLQATQTRGRKSGAGEAAGPSMHSTRGHQVKRKKKKSQDVYRKANAQVPTCITLRL